MIQTDIKKTISELLADRITNSSMNNFIFFDGKTITYKQLGNTIGNVTHGLSSLGIHQGDTVAIMMGNHIEHITTFFALAMLGCIYVPINIFLKGPSLEHIFNQTNPTILITDDCFLQTLSPIIKRLKVMTIVNQQNKNQAIGANYVDLNMLSEQLESAFEFDTMPSNLDETRVISFTSGTTGPPKGVMQTERMILTCAIGAGLASEVQNDDVFLLWEPLYHNSGIQICLLALMIPIFIVMVPRFSASQFWDWVRTYHVTKIHYLGGIIDILLKHPASELDRKHKVRLAFGAGCKTNSWHLFENRFGIKIREVYGLTEASGFSTLNETGKIGSIGKPLPYFELKITGEDGATLSENQIGEIVIREKSSGLITHGYYGNQAATSELLKGGWLHTGDLGYRDSEGDYFFVGRCKDCIRRRGENISAWEIEQVMITYPEIEECTVIGVDAEIGEQEIKALIKVIPGKSPTPLDIVRWCEQKLPYYQIPRYIEFVKYFEKTGTQRIRKDQLSKDIENCWDLEKSGYTIYRR